MLLRQAAELQGGCDTGAGTEIVVSFPHGLKLHVRKCLPFSTTFLDSGRRGARTQHKRTCPLCRYSLQSEETALSLQPSQGLLRGQVSLPDVTPDLQEPTPCLGRQGRQVLCAHGHTCPTPSPVEHLLSLLPPHCVLLSTLFFVSWLFRSTNKYAHGK